MRTLEVTLKTISYILISLVLVLAVLLVGLKIFGFQIYTVLSGSMEPEYKTGGLVYIILGIVLVMFALSVYVLCAYIKKRNKVEEQAELDKESEPEEKTDAEW